MRRPDLFTGLAAMLMAAFAFVAAPTMAAAEPPPWAPAHGYRAKHGHHQQARYEPRPEIPDYLKGGRCNRETLGAILGGATGAAVGSQIGSGSGKTAAVIGGALLGVLIGKDIGRTLDRADSACTREALEHLPDGRAVAWHDPNTDAHYRVRPTASYESRDGLYCREYQAKATVGGRERQTYGTACRMPDGDWKLMN